MNRFLFSCVVLIMLSSSLARADNGLYLGLDIGANNDARFEDTDGNVLGVVVGYHVNDFIFEVNRKNLGSYDCWASLDRNDFSTTRCEYTLMSYAAGRVIRTGDKHFIIPKIRYNDLDSNWEHYEGEDLPFDAYGFSVEYKYNLTDHIGLGAEYLTYEGDAAEFITNTVSVGFKYKF